MRTHWRGLTKFAVLLCLAVAAVFLFGLGQSKTVHANVALTSDRVTTVYPRLATAVAVAVHIWGDVCHGQVAVTFAPLEAPTEAQAVYAYDPDNPAASSFINCSVVITSLHKYDYTDFCAVIVHEYGHLDGREHSTNRRSVMYPYLTDLNTPDRCAP